MPQSNAKKRCYFRVAIAVPLYRHFDYYAPSGCEINSIRPGIRVLVPFGHKKKVAYLISIVKESDRPESSLKTVEALLDREPLLNGEDLKLLRWACDYYHYPIGEVISTAFPASLRKGKEAVIENECYFKLTLSGRAMPPASLGRAKLQAALLAYFQAAGCELNETQLALWKKSWRPPLKALQGKGLLEITQLSDPVSGQKIIRESHLPANAEQRQAIEQIRQQHGFRVFLLEGVTGSGKTEVYLQVIHEVIKRQKQVMVLLPEITLTPQLQQRFKQRFNINIAVYHSGLSDKARLHAWLSFQQGRSGILLGTRSALFTPFQSPGMIILDEEHDSSFKQQEGFRFSARDIAVVRGKMLNIPVLLGSATPSLESLHNVQRKRYQILHLKQRAGQALHPDLELLDIRNKKMIDGLSAPLLKQMQRHLDHKQQILLFLNRRGFATALICHHCGWVARCQRCDANLVVHQQTAQLRCHHCGWGQKLSRFCRACNSTQMTVLGIGTERVESRLIQLFPNEKVIRLDRDTTARKGEMEKRLEAIKQGECRIILGTQMLAKGHHFPNVTLVALLDVDSGLFSVDFHAAEKLAQLIVQVSGRAGRAEKKGKVVLQTRQPDHPLLQTMVYRDYRTFAEQALKERKQGGLPPYSYQALIRAAGQELNEPFEFLQQLRVFVQANQSGSVLVLGPAPAPMIRKAGWFRYQLLVQSKNRKILHSLLDKLVHELERNKPSGKIRWSLDVDPVDLY